MCHQFPFSSPLWSLLHTGLPEKKEKEWCCLLSLQLENGDFCRPKQIAMSIEEEEEEEEEERDEKGGEERERE